MRNQKERLKEKCLLFLYVLSFFTKEVNKNTFKRYLYLYYFSSSFFKDKVDNIFIEINKGNIEIQNLNIILSDFSSDGYVKIDDNKIIIENKLNELVEKLLNGLNGEKGSFYELYSEIKPFVNLLNSYTEEFIFTIFFSEPTFREANERNIEKIKISDSKLVKLLNRFKKKLDNKKIDNYDILTYWMDFILKNYYEVEEKNSELR